MTNILISSKINTRLGNMIAISNETKLYLLAFEDQKGLEKEINKLSIKTAAKIIDGTTKPIQLITYELNSYFSGILKKFTTPINLLGSDFQKECWNSLQNIPYGEIISYSCQANSIERPKSYRAVANANSKNKLAIIVPCHRIINNNGNLGGYAGGIERKEWLINHEKTKQTILN